MDRYKWQTDRVTEKFYGLQNDQDRDAFFRDVGILNPRNYGSCGAQDIAAECSICYEIGVSLFAINKIRLHPYHQLVTAFVFL